MRATFKIAVTRRLANCLQDQETEILKSAYLTQFFVTHSQIDKALREKQPTRKFSYLLKMRRFFFCFGRRFSGPTQFTTGVTICEIQYRLSSAEHANQPGDPLVHIRVSCCKTKVSVHVGRFVKNKAIGQQCPHSSNKPAIILCIWPSRIACETNILSTHTL